MKIHAIKEMTPATKTIISEIMPIIIKIKRKRKPTNLIIVFIINLETNSPGSNPDAFFSCILFHGENRVLKSRFTEKKL
jgi:hypothetical protein